MKIYHSSFEKHKQTINKKAQDKLDKLKVKCKVCGHTIFMKVQEDYRICNFCKNKVRNNTSEYFVYKVRKEMEKINERV